MQKTLKILLAVGIVAFSAFITATSCDKNDPSGGGGSGGDNAPLSLFLTNAPFSDVVKLRGNTAVVNASTWERTFTNVGGIGTLGRLFTIRSTDELVDPKSILYFVNRTHITKDTITVKAVATASCSTNESQANALAAAAGGGHCRQYDADGRGLKFKSYLGTVFNNTKTATHARGALVLETGIYGFNRGEPSLGRFSIIGDTTAFGELSDPNIHLSVVTNTDVTATINDAWVTDDGSTTEVELYAIAIDVTGKTFEEFSGLKKADFDKEIDNATFKKMLQKNRWGELKFKIKIVTAADFTAAQ